MSVVYVDTSALGRSLLGEPDKPAIERALETFASRISSSLLRVELRRLGLRRDLLDRVDTLLSGIALIPLDDEILKAAESNWLPARRSMASRCSPRAEAVSPMPRVR